MYVCPGFRLIAHLLVIEMLEDLGLLVELAGWSFCLLHKFEEGRLHVLIHFLQLRDGENRSVNCYAAFAVTSRKKEKLFRMP